MFDAKKLLDQFLGAQVPGIGGTVREKAGQATQLAKDNPLKTMGLAGLLLGTGTGRDIAGGALKIGGLAAIAGLGYQAYKNYQAGQAPDATPAPAPAAGAPPELLPPPADSGFSTEPHVLRNDFVLTLLQAMIAASSTLRGWGNMACSIAWGSRMAAPRCWWWGRRAMAWRPSPCKMILI